MPHTTINQQQIYYELSGSGKQVLVLFNGITMSTASWALMEPLLEPHYQILRFDFPGQGQSDHPVVPDYVLQDQADCAKRLLDTLGLDNIYLVGLSYGGMVAQHFVHRHPDKVQKLLLASTLAWSDNVDKWISKSLLDAQQAGGLDLRYTVGVPWLFSNRFLANSSHTLDDMKTITGMVDWEAAKRLIAGVHQHDARNWLHTITTPTHILIGGEDRLTPKHQAEFLHMNIPGSSLEVIPQAGHAIHIEAFDTFCRSIVLFGAKHS